MLHREVYQRTPQFEERVAGARLRTYEWQFLANLDGKATVGEILRRLKIDESTIADFIFEQERNGAIAPRLLSFEEFINSGEPQVDDEEPDGPPRHSTVAGAQVKRTAGEELRAIARLSIAAAIGEILSLISKRRAAAAVASPPQAAPKAPPAAPAEPAAYAPPMPPAEEAAREDLASFQVFDWTLPVASHAEPMTHLEAVPDVEPTPQVEPMPQVETIPHLDALPPVEAASNGALSHEVEMHIERGLDEADVDYLHAFAEEPVVFEDGLSIADRLLRDYGPLDATEVRLPDVPVADSDVAAAEFDGPETHARQPHDTEAQLPPVHEPVPFETTPSAAAEPPKPPWYVAEPYRQPMPESAREAEPAAEGASDERDPHRVTFSVNDLAGYIERVEPSPQAEAVPFYAPALEAPLAVPLEPAQAVAPEPEPEPEHVEAHDPSMDPIVFSLSARNPDSFWSGKK